MGRRGGGRCAGAAGPEDVPVLLRRGDPGRQPGRLLSAERTGRRAELRQHRHHPAAERASRELQVRRRDGHRWGAGDRPHRPGRLRLVRRCERGVRQDRLGGPARRRRPRPLHRQPGRYRLVGGVVVPGRRAGHRPGEAVEPGRRQRRHRGVRQRRGAAEHQRDAGRLPGRLGWDHPHLATLRRRQAASCGVRVRHRREGVEAVRGRCAGHLRGQRGRVPVQQSRVRVGAGRRAAHLRRATGVPRHRRHGVRLPRRYLLEAAQRCAAYQGPSSVDTGQSQMAPAELQGLGATAALQDVVTAENGNLLVAGDGTVTFKQRSTRYNTTAVATLGELETPYLGDLAVGFDPTFTYERVEVTRPGGVTVAAFDLAGQKRYGPRTLTETPQILLDLEATDRANYQLAQYKDPKVRLPQVTLDPASNPGLWPVVLGTKIGDRLTVKRRPFGAPLITLDVFVEAISHDVDFRVGQTHWRTTYLLSPAVSSNFWLAGDATYSIAGVSTVPGYGVLPLPLLLSTGPRPLAATCAAAAAAILLYPSVRRIIGMASRAVRSHTRSPRRPEIADLRSACGVVDGPAGTAVPPSSRRDVRVRLVKRVATLAVRLPH